MPIRPFENQSPVIPATAYVDASAVVIGAVTLGEHASIWPLVTARGDINNISIGARTNIQDNTVLHVTHAGQYCPGGLPLTIGEAVTVGHQVTLHACTVEHHCLIGIGSVVLDGAVLEPYTLLAAGSLVSPHKTLEGGHLWRGSPARKVRALNEEEIAYFEYSANYYAELAQRHIQTSV